MGLKHQWVILSLSVWLAACHTAPSSPGTPTLIIKSFTVSPNPVERGDTLAVNWDVPGATHVTLRAMRTPTGSNGDLWWSPLSEEFGMPLTFGSATGQVTVLVPSDLYDRSFRFDLEATGTLSTTVTAESETISLKCPPLIVDDRYMELCPFPKHVIQASYQPFESGYLIWRGDTQEIYVLPANETYFSNWHLLPAVNQTEPIPSAAPPGSYAPGKQFAGLWSSFKIGVAEAKSEGYSPIEMPLNEFLGWATAPEQVYDMTMQFSWGNKGTVASPILLLSFPDQQVATLIAAGGPNSTSGPAWFP